MNGMGIEVKEIYFPWMEQAGFQRMECTGNDWKSLPWKGVKNVQELTM